MEGNGCFASSCRGVLGGSGWVVAGGLDTEERLYVTVFNVTRPLDDAECEGGSKGVFEERL